MCFGVLFSPTIPTLGCWGLKGPWWEVESWASIRSETAHWVRAPMALSENVGLIFPMIASHFSWRDHDQQNHWVQWGTQHFQTHPNMGSQWDLSPWPPVPLCRVPFEKTALLSGPALTVASVKPLTPPRGVRGTQREESHKVTFRGKMIIKHVFFLGYPCFRHTQMFGLFPLPGCWNFLCTMFVLGRDPKLNQVE